MNERENLTDADREALYGVWLGNDVSRGLDWLFPTVESIVARHVEVAKATLDRVRALAERTHGIWDTSGGLWIPVADLRAALDGDDQ